MSIEDRAREWARRTPWQVDDMSLIDFAKSEFPREREEAVREFIEKWRAKTMEHFENDIWTSADAEVFKEIFGKDL
jgi:hypothetical protein